MEVVQKKNMNWYLILQGWLSFLGTEFSFPGKKKSNIKLGV